jgi:hypothetical protein
MNEEEKKENIKTCDDIISKFKKMAKPIRDRPDIYFLVDELKTKVEWLKDLYKQIIS